MIRMHTYVHPQHMQVLSSTLHMFDTEVGVIMNESRASTTAYCITLWFVAQDYPGLAVTSDRLGQ